MYDDLVFSNTPCTITEFFEAFRQAKVGSIVCKQQVSTIGGWAYLKKVKEDYADWRYSRWPEKKEMSFSMVDGPYNSAFISGKTFLVVRDTLIEPDLLWE